jgi:hypothetical protein
MFLSATQEVDVVTSGCVSRPGDDNFAARVRNYFRLHIVRTGSEASFLKGKATGDFSHHYSLS